MYYTPTVLKSVGVPDGNMLYGVTALVGLSKVRCVQLRHLGETYHRSAITSSACRGT